MVGVHKGLEVYNTLSLHHNLGSKAWLGEYLPNLVFKGAFSFFEDSWSREPAVGER